MPRSTTYLIGLGCAVLVILTGCGGKPPLVAYQGDIQLEGKPLRNAMITFHPLDAKGSVDPKAMTPMATSDEAGKFVMRTPNEGDGVTPGTYKVTVSALSAPSASDKQAAFPGNSEQVKAVSLVAPEFSDVNKTPLKVTIPATSTLIEVKGPGK